MEPIDVSNLYRLPWTKDDNPTGWIEPTTFCQLACPGCYRGLDKPNPERYHEGLTKQKKQIDKLIKIRKIQTIAVAGGEPLLYPKLDDLIAYAHKRGLGVRIFSNGCALTEQRLKKLKKLGTTEMIIHVGDYQNRAQRENSLYKIRDYYCDLFRKVKGVDLHFILTVSKKNVAKLPKLMEYYRQNSDVVTHFVFTTYNDLYPKVNFQRDKYVTSAKIKRLIEKHYKAEPCAYLPKTLDENKFSWLFFAPVLWGNKVVGSLSPKTVAKIYKKFQIEKQAKFPLNGSKVDPTVAIKLLSDIKIYPIIKNVAWEIIKKPTEAFSSLKVQLILLLDSPTYTKDGWSFCEGCPDAMFHKGKLVHSCILELVKDKRYQQPEMFL